MTENELKSRLRAARALIDQPEKWTQHAMWRDSRGNRACTLPEPNDIASRCASGAINEVSLFGESLEIRRQLLNSIYRHAPAAARDSGVTGWNDEPGRTHADVMQAFDRAIADTHPG